MQAVPSSLMVYLAFVAALLGLCMGSFLNCLAWRMTHGESVMHGRSHCTTCGHVLSVRDLVPVLSWAASRGRCRYCGERVSARYPATELLCGVVYVSLFMRYGLTLETLELTAFASVLLVLSLTDLDDYVIPNGTIVAAIVIRLAYLGAGGALGLFDGLALLRDSLVGGVAVALPVLALTLVMDRVLGRESFGGGDIKLLFVAGLYFGWQQCLFLVVVACVLGIVFAMLGTRAQGGEGNKREGAAAENDAEKPADPVANDADADEETGSHLIPFGPSIAAACWITMMVGTQVLSWYLGLVGI